MEAAIPERAIIVQPVGLVESSVKEPILLSHDKGLEMSGRIEDFWRKVWEVELSESDKIIDPKRIGLLQGIEAYSHLLVIYWAHKTPVAGRQLDRVHPSQPPGCLIAASKALGASVSPSPLPGA